MRVVELLLAALEVQWPGHHSQLSASVTHAPFGNQSHPWLDTDRTPGERVALLMDNMTIHDKLSMLEGASTLANHGVGAAVNPCIGLIKTPKRLGIPNLCMGDGPSGVSNGLGNVTTFPAPIVISSSWDLDLMYDYAKAIAREHRGKGHNVALTPTINIQRTPLWGRNAESFSEDPYLTSELAVASVKGTQSEGILASVKHFAAYNQETNRFGDGPEWKAANVIVSNRTLQELYFPAFKAVVQRADPGSVMTSYNKVNGIHTSENPSLLSDLTSWGFKDAFTVTDWYFGHRSTVAAALAGQTMSMPGGKSDFGFEDFYSEENLVAAISDGSLPVEVLDDMVHRVLTPMFVHGLVDNVETLGDVVADVRRREHHELSVRAVEQGSILLKNKNCTLPFTSDLSKIAVIGPGGDYGALVSERYGGFVGSPNLNEALVTPLQGIRQRAGDDATVAFAQGLRSISEYDDVPPLSFSFEGVAGLWTRIYNTSDWTGESIVDDIRANTTAAFRLDINQTLSPSASAIYYGFFTPGETGLYDFAIYAGGYAKLRIAGEDIIWLRKEDFVNYASGQIYLTAGQQVPLKLEYSAGPAITSSGLSFTYLTPAVRSSLLRSAVEVANQSDVAVVFVGNILSEGGDGTSLQLPAVQDDLVKEIAQVVPKIIIVAQTNNPFLMPWLDDVDAVLLQWYAGEGVGTALASLLYGDVNPSGKLAMTFPPAENIGPTASLRAFPGEEADSMNGNNDVHYDEGLLVGYRWFDNYDIEPLFPFGHGLSYSSFILSTALQHNCDSVSVAVQVTNLGPFAGSEVVQLYVGYPSSVGEPPKVLKAFEKVRLKVGGVTTAQLNVSREQLAHWSEDTGQWVVTAGEFKLYVGTSSRDVHWTGSIQI